MTNQLGRHLGKPNRSKQREISHTPPALPWPLLAGTCDLEVARWPYPATSSRKAGEWHYFVHLFVSGGVLSLRGLRTRQTNVRYDRFVEMVSAEVQTPIRSKAQLVQVFESFVQTLIERAHHDTKRYEEITFRMARAASMRLFARLVFALEP